MTTPDEYERRIGKIESTHLGYEDHGILTAYLRMGYGALANSIGGYFLGPNSGPAMAKFIAGVLAATHVTRWEAVAGRTVFVLEKDGRVEGIEPLPTERGERFLFSDAFEPAAATS